MEQDRKEYLVKKIYSSYGHVIENEFISNENVTAKELDILERDGCIFKAYDRIYLTSICRYHLDTTGKNLL